MGSLTLKKKKKRRNGKDETSSPRKRKQNRKESHEGEVLNPENEERKGRHVLQYMVSKVEVNGT